MCWCIIRSENAIHEREASPLQRPKGYREVSLMTPYRDDAALYQESCVRTRSIWPSHFEKLIIDTNETGCHKGLPSSMDFQTRRKF